MSKQHHGRAAIYGIDGKIAYSGIATTESEIQGANFTEDFDVSEIMDRNAEVIGATSRNPRQSLTIDMHIVQAAGGTQSIATAKGNWTKPTPMAIVVLSEFGIADIDGEWNYAGGVTAAFTPEGYMRMTVPLRRNAGAALQPVSA